MDVKGNVGRGEKRLEKERWEEGRNIKVRERTGTQAQIREGSRDSSCQ